MNVSGRGATSPGLWAVVLAASFAFFILTALLIGASQWILLAGFLLLGAFVALILVSGRTIEDRSGWMLIAGWIAMLLTPALRNLSGLPVGYVLELLIFGLALASIRVLWRMAAADRALRLLLILLCLHFFLALLSTYFGRSKTAAALWQLQYNLKWPLMFGLGLLAVWSDRTERVVRKVAAYSWLFLVPVVVFEIAMPGAYMKVFGLSTDSNLNPVLGTDLRHRGPFANAGNLAMVSALLSTAAMAQVLNGRSRWWGVLALGYGALVIFTGQRQELFALATCALLFVMFHFRRHMVFVPLVLGAAAIVMAATFIYLDYVPLKSTLIQWGVIDGVIPYSERFILTMKGIAVAWHYFPLGSGLGTYGGAGAQRFDLSLFSDLGFGNYWWFIQGKFLLDTYWPNIAAESGFFGAVLLLAFFALMWGALLIRAWRSAGSEGYGFAFLGLASVTLLVMNTPSAQTLTDPRGAIVFWILIGAAWRMTSPAARSTASERTEHRSARHPRLALGSGA